MRSFFTKISATFIIICLVYGNISIAAFADPSSDFSYIENSGEITITGYLGSGNSLSIPDKINGIPVTAIGDEAFEENNQILSVFIPEGVKKIGYAAFYFCINLSDVNFPDSMVSIGDHCFQGTGIDIVTIPTKTVEIGQYAFSHCASIQSFTVENDNPSYTSINGVLFDKSATRLIQYPPAKADLEYRIPDGVSGMDNCAFSLCNLNSVICPDSLREISCFAFDECTELTNITFNEGFRNIAQDSFNNCVKLKSINLPSSMNYIDMDAFDGCPNITEVNVSPGGAIYSSIDGILYEKNSIQYYPIAKNKDCKIPEGTVNVYDYAFRNSLVGNVVCPSTLKHIGPESFENCKNLQTIEFSSGIQEIYGYAFYECSSLKRAIFYGDKPQIGEEAFGLADNSFSIYYPVAYSASWSGYNAYPCKPYCMLTLDKQDGSAPSTSMAYVTNGHIEKPADPVRADSVFGGWYTEAACMNQWDFNTSVVTGDISLFARWLPATNKVFFNPGAGATVNPESKAVNYGGTYGDLPTPTKPGNLFDGWYTGADGTGTKIIASDTVTITSDITLYAKWLSATYTVTFNPGQGVSVSPASKAVTYGGTYGDLPVPVKSGNLFSGWYTAPDSTGSRVTAADTVAITSNQTLYARWVAQKLSANLTGISFSAGKLTKAFSSARTSYTLKLGENDGTVTIIPAKAYSGARMTIGGTTAEKKTVTVANGKTVKVKIVVKNGKLSKTYTISITRAKSTNNRLSSLTVSAGTLSPSFTGTATSYKLLLPASTTKVTLKAARESTLAKVSPASKTVKLKNGQTVKVKFTVRAQSGAVKTYTVTVQRAIN